LIDLFAMIFNYLWKVTIKEVGKMLSCINFFDEFSLIVLSKLFLFCLYLNIWRYTLHSVCFFFNISSSKLAIFYIFSPRLFSNYICLCSPFEYCLSHFPKNSMGKAGLWRKVSANPLTRTCDNGDSSMYLIGSYDM